MNDLECPKCGHKFILKEDYLSGECSNCGKMYYYWDHVYDEETNETFFEGYHWEIN